ncbi:flagellar protein FlhE [Kushneria indalinina]|uniref:Protein FlhE n=1 Tax=Kushneria indalinina DSM 14324 TaxID=1122140 RepID=A0A3D9E1D9_9GAMM|nr:flagellar protein FlhE [Kushneria indalinina]REC96349.1 protein FlhE [Kushneria indalinina DSM 14324]
MITRLLPGLMITAALASPMVFAGASAGGAIPVQGNIPDMRQKGWEYRVALMPADSAPAGSQLTELSWHYELAPSGPAPAAWLCTPAECVALNLAYGSTDALAGLPASTPLSLRFVLPGEGMLKRPVRGGVAQVFVNYRTQE